MICNTHLQVPLLRKDNVTNTYKIFTFIAIIFSTFTIPSTSLVNAHLNCKRLPYEFLLF